MIGKNGILGATPTNFPTFGPLSRPEFDKNPKVKLGAMISFIIESMLNIAFFVGGNSPEVGGGTRGVDKIR